MRDVIRTCIGCRGKFSQKTLIRFVNQNNEALQIDNQKQLHGRGAYVCHAQSCIQKAFKAPRRINTLLRGQLTNVVIQQFAKALLEWTEKSASTIEKQEELS